MNPSDKKAFKNMMDGLSDVYQRKEKISDVALRLYFSSLQDFSLDQVAVAITRHLKDKASGQFFPKPSDIERHITGKDPTADEIVAAARLANCPMGVMARMHIGTWDLQNQDAFYLRQRAEEVIQLLPEWKARANAGEFTQHELSVMVKYKIDPSGPFFLGQMRPAAHQLISQKVSALPPPEPEQKPEIDIEPNPENRKRLNELIKGLLSDPEPEKPTDKPKAERLKFSPCGGCGASFEEILKICSKCGEKRDERMPNG